ncbi:putative enoyl-CoA hydratase 2 [Citrus sinensis]|uniref:Enoyl-CoA hydratase 2 n=1 Tax=Citrus sinensis TaxID=2711 RepID=A0ACB8LUU6_CITSI|nr:putative enoyl-CoA hydratase 2 [Citrus sinensis]
MSALTKLTKTLAHHCVKKSKTHWCKSSQPLLNLLISENIVNINTSQFHQYQSRRTLILDSASSESVQLQRLSDSDSGIIEVSLNRPAAKNALGTDMLRGLKHAFETISEDSSANVVMIRSSVPKVFCAGADLKALPIPTIAVIDGAALGGGLEMALACDLRICGEAALLGLPETGLAIIPGAGGTQRLPRLVGKSVAKDIIFTGRKVSGKDAMSLVKECHTAGLVNYYVPAGQAQLKALEIAQEINQKGPIAIRMAKRAITKGLEVDMASALELEEECYIETLHTEDRLEGLAAFAEKRKPKYTGT